MMPNKNYKGIEMKIIISGMNGTVAPVLREACRKQNWQVIAWDRNKVSPDNEKQCREYLLEQSPDWVCHLAMGSEKWAQVIAEFCQQQGRGFLFTSTAMVFDCAIDGPHKVNDARNAKDGYGQYKIRCEDAIREVNDKAIIGRIGWQIGESRGGNNMLEALYGMVEKDGVIHASNLWFPATSFIKDTSDTLVQLIKNGVPGTYHIDSNHKCKYSFVEIVKFLKRLHKTDWQIKENSDYKHDQRLVDDRVTIASLTERFHCVL